MEQLSLFDGFGKIESQGYKVEKAFNVNFGNKLDDTYKVIKDNMIIAHIQTNKNGTYNVIGGLSIRYNLNIDESVERINFINKYRLK